MEVRTKAGVGANAMDKYGETALMKAENVDKEGVLQNQHHIFR